MKVYVAPKAAVLSMNVKENIASSSQVTFNGTYYWNAGTGKVQASDFVYTGSNYVMDMVNWLIDSLTTHNDQYVRDQRALLEGCLVARPDADKRSLI